MKRSKENAGLSYLSLCICAALIVGATSAAMAGTSPLRIIYRLTASVDGNNSDSPLVRDAAGNLYGTTVSGGSTACLEGCGTVFELSPTSQGGWKNTVLHKFAGTNDGANIYGALAIDSAGNLYGTAANGGKNGYGNVFELSPQTSGQWKFSVLYPFQNSGDGRNPTHGVVVDGSGNLFGVSSSAIFELSPTTAGGWKHTVLHHFGQTDEPSGVTLDANGNIFGVTSWAGMTNPTTCPNGCGTVFELSPGVTLWKYKVLYSFTGNADGGVPTEQLVFDSLGNLYGVTNLGGNVSDCAGVGCGTVYELIPSGNVWTQTVLWAFSYPNGDQPHGPLVFDASGNIYGTARFDNANNCGCGVVYELSPSSGAWSQTILHTFVGSNDGAFPNAGLTPDGAGNFYGNTTGGGNSTQSGTIFFLTP